MKLVSNHRGKAHRSTSMKLVEDISVELVKDMSLKLTRFTSMELAKAQA